MRRPRHYAATWGAQALGEGLIGGIRHMTGTPIDERGPGYDFFAKQRIFLGGNRANRGLGRRSGGVMRNPNYTYADTMLPSMTKGTKKPIPVNHGLAGISQNQIMG